MKQLYCKPCTMFLADRFVIGNCKSCKAFTKADQCDSCNKVFEAPEKELYNIKCSICSSQPEVRSTTHLFLNFQNNPKIKEKLNNWLNENNRIQEWSNNAKGDTRNWLRENNLKDRCITRDLKWGVKVPLKNYESKVFYVWFDAPIGYISITKQLFKEGIDHEKWWKRSKQYDVELMQFMGKDNILFHSVLFPSTLLSTKSQAQNISAYNLVQKLSVTEYLRYEGGKFSKSQNRGVFGNDCKQTNIDSDVWRYYLLSNRPQNYDTEFSWEQFAYKNNKELMNSIGNLYNRIFKVAYKDYISLEPSMRKIPTLQNLQQPQNKLIDELKGMFAKYIQALSKN